MLVEKTRTTEVTGEVITDNFTYGVNYSLNGGELIRLVCNVNKKVVTEVETPDGKQPVEELLYVGNLVSEGGNNQVYLQSEEAITPHVTVFETVLAEVKASLAPAPASKRATKE